MRAHAFLPRPWRFAVLALPLLLAACESPLHAVREHRFGSGTTPAAPSVRPQALALALQAAPDGHGLTPESLQQANAMLTSQGRLSSQVLTITPFNARGELLAPRLAAALQRAGAQAPRIAPIPAGERLAQAGQAHWDLELQSEALIVDVADCRIAENSAWTIHPYYGIGTLGCVNRANIARMTTDPRDLDRPRTLDATDGTVAAAAVQRYQEGDIHDLIDIDFEED
ncbi:CpaD family pilus assembly lipoprotein [Corticibacter populi]|nr:CpaD family pilus assembly lipoprotein [Corticibacter populi]RZS31561.1 pilus assembly protein CpaD [Corticibacter populi]